MGISRWTDAFFDKVQTLIGERGRKEDSALRWRDMDAIQLGAAKVVNIKGLAIFGGDLKSDDYVSGVSGWIISKLGNAQFWNLIVRGWLQDGAVTDKWQDILPGSMNGTTALTTVVSIDLGAIGNGVILLRGVKFEARNPGYVLATPSTHMTVTLQSRVKVLGGAFSAWIDRSTFDIDTTGWDVYASGSTLNGEYDDYEYRLVYQNASSANNANAVIRQVYLTVTLVTK
jgi:hypothetical protein